MTGIDRARYRRHLTVYGFRIKTLAMPTHCLSLTAAEFLRLPPDLRAFVVATLRWSVASRRGAR